MTTDTDLRTIDHPVGRDGLFVLRVDSGDAHLRGVDGDRVTVRSTDGDPLDGFEIERGDGSLAVRARNSEHGRRRSAASADLAVDLPRGATVVVEAGSADIVADGLAGDSRLMTTSGDLTIRDVRGTLTAEAVSGDVEIDAPEALAVAVRTVSGDLVLRAGVLSGLKAATTSGDATIVGRFAGDGPFSLETVSGDASLEPIGDLRIEFTTLTGDIHGRGIGHRSARDRAPIVVGSGGGPTLAFRSTSGDLSLSPRPDAESGRTLRAVADPAAALAPGAAGSGDEDDRDADAHDADAHDADDRFDANLEILRSLERGDIDVDEAKRQLAGVDPSDADAAEPERSDD
jgi:hypothetical protein